MTKNSPSKLHDYFTQLDRERLRSGKLAMFETNTGFWHPSILSEVQQVFEQFNIAQFNNFIDLGSGDGRVVLLASHYCKKATGVESDTTLHDTALRAKQTLNNTAQFLCTDAYNHSLAGYDLVFLYPDTPFHRGMEHKIKKELTGHLLVCGRTFLPQTLTKQKQIEINETSFTLFR